jgi:hypothetical protein
MSILDIPVRIAQGVDCEERGKAVGLNVLTVGIKIMPIGMQR